MHDEEAADSGTASVAVDDPQSYISLDRRRALAEGRELAHEVHGAALFADISGFTSLTEALAQELGPQRGAEELTANLNRIYQAVIDEVHRAGGDVIYFSGDAITCWHDGDDGRRAAACALAMQTVIEKVGVVSTPGGRTVVLAIKVAVAVGAAKRFFVGDPSIQLIEVLAGSLLDDLAASEHLAQSGDVVLHSSALDALGESAEVSDRRVDPATGLTVGLLARLTVDVVPVMMPLPPPLTDEQVRPWLLPTVYERLSTGRGEFVSELRAAYPVFVRFGGLDHDNDPTARDRLDEFISAAQRVLDRYGGHLLNLTMGDKGAYLFIAFGSPISHEDDAARAVAAAAELLTVPATGGVRDLQIGIAHGRMRSGTYGHAARRAFTCLGDAVNLAARLMSGAPAGSIHVTEAVQRAAGDAFAWGSMGARTFKGKTELTEVYNYVGRRQRSAQRVLRYPLPIVGRNRELAAIPAALDRARRGAGEIVHIVADAGQGKSRLVAEAIRAIRAGGVRLVLGQATSLVTSYQLWREIWRALLGLEDRDHDAVELLADVEAALGAIDPALVGRAPLLGAVFGTTLPDTDLTAAFDAKLRKTSLEALLVDVLRAKAVEPLVVVLEDAHWIDPMSRDLLDLVVAAIIDLPVLLVVAQRPGVDLALPDHGAITELVLTDLSADDVATVIDAKARQVFGRPPGAALAALVASRAGGNPFYIEELLHYLHQRGVGVDDDALLERVQLPESLHALVLSRVDGLDEGPRRTLKVASVVGREFTGAALVGAYPDLGSAEAVGAALRRLQQVDLVVSDRLGGDDWLFHHAIIRDVAYESLPFAMRSELHERVGQFLERTAPDLDRLAHHYWHSDNLAKKRHFLLLAGEASRAAYANAAAIEQFGRLAEVADGVERADALLQLGKVFELTGDWARAESVERDALQTALAHGDSGVEARCETALAEVARKQGRYDEAAARLAEARHAFEAIGDRAGLGQVLHVAGTVAAQKGDYDQAAAHYRESLTLREALGDTAAAASLLSNLGVVAEYEGDLDGSRALHERALAARREIGDRWAVAVSLTNLGMVAVLEQRFGDARGLFDEALRLNLEVGDPWMVAIGHHNLGNAWRGLDEAPSAATEYATALRAFVSHDDRWAIAFLLEDLAALVGAQGHHDTALRLAGGADAARAELGAVRSSALEAELAAHLEPAVRALGSDAAETVRDIGRKGGLDTAVNIALRECDQLGAPSTPRPL